MSMKNMAVMFGAMAFMRRLDQEEPMVLMYARMGFLCYVVITASIYVVLHLKIIAQRDTSLITVPVTAKTPSFSEAMTAAQDAATEKQEKDGDEDKREETSKPEEEKPTEETLTVMEYDLRQLSAARKSWLTNSCLLAAIHYKMESVSPLVMSSLMGLTRMMSDDQLFQIHIKGTPAVGALKRPFVADKNPFANMLKDMAAKQEEPKDTADDASTDVASTATRPTVVEEDLHDDGDSEEDDSPPPAIADLKDDHIKSDFDDEDAADTEDKKDK